MAFDPDKFIAGSGGFDPDKFIADQPQEQPSLSWGDMAKDVAGRIVRYSPPGMMVRAAMDPAGTLQSTDDAVRAAANAVTFGMADRFAGYMGGEGTDAEVAKSAAARERSPAASLAGDVAGSVALPGFGAARLAARMGGGVAARAGAYGLTGGATGAAQGAGTTYTGNPWDYAQNALIGGAMGSVLGAGSGAAFGARPRTTTAAEPTVEQQRIAKNIAYDAANTNPARYDASFLASRADDLENRFATSADRYWRPDSPVTFRALDDMHAPAAAAARAGAARATVDPGNIDIIRKGLNNIPPERSVDKASGRIVRRALDDFIENPPPGAVAPGFERDAARASTQMGLARELHGGYKRSDISRALIQRASDTSSSNYAGLNFENEMRKEYRKFITPDIKTGRSKAQNANYSPAEIERIRSFVDGDDVSFVRNPLRWAAKTAGGGSGLGALAAAGVGGAGVGYYSDDMRLVGGLGLPAAGLGMRVLGNRLAMQQARGIDRMVRQRNPLYQLNLQNAPLSPQVGSDRSARAARDALTLQMLKQTEDKRRTRNAP